MLEWFQQNEILAIMMVLFFILTILAVKCSSLFYKQFLKWKAQKRMAQSGIKDIDRMDGFQFEAYLKVLFKKLGYRPVVTQKSGDYGADVILQGKNKVVIQAKRYGYKNRVSMDAVREVYAAQAFYQADEAWVITNSFFTKQAIELAKACGVKLLNRYELEQFIIKINPEQSPKEVLRKKAFIK
ncbi:restriction endonuclease [Virgibacillus dokdonensis]